MRLTSDCRAKALEAGIYAARDGRRIRLRRMADAHLVNAYLRALSDGEPRGVTEPLAREVVRRGLREAAEREVERRCGR